MYEITTLSNGIRTVTYESMDRESVSIGIWIGVGGRYENDTVKGAAHFLEHIAFKGSKKYTCKQIKELIEGVGGTLNAFTSEEQTCFFAKIPYRYLEQTFDVLADIVLYPKIAKSDVDKERMVILEEIKMYKDMPQYFVLELLDELLWPNHPLGKTLTGTPESVMGLTNKVLHRFHQKYYFANNIVVAGVGKLKHSKIVRMIRKKMSVLASTSNRNDYLRVTEYESIPKAVFFKKDVEQMHVALGMPAFDENHKDRYIMGLLNIILGGNMSSRLFVEVREKKGLAYSISSSVKTLHDTGVFIIRAGVDNRKIVEAVKLILAELNKIRTSLVSSNEFNRARDYLLGQLLLGLEDTMEHMLWIGEDLITRNKVRTIQHVVREFKKIKREDIIRVAKEVINPAKFRLSIVGPIKDEQEKQIRTLLGIK